jgi:hypothetical protein
LKPQAFSLPARGGRDRAAQGNTALGAVLDTDGMSKPEKEKFLLKLL